MENEEFKEFCDICGCRIDSFGMERHLEWCLNLDKNKKKLYEEKSDFTYAFLLGMAIQKAFDLLDIGKEKEGETHGKGKSKVKRKQGNK